ncbi:MAG: hypothetical protein QG635_516 [Bacteroidota bacterium]|nr:hypothetical protein [Bacteroidota bacterium]
MKTTKKIVFTTLALFIMFYSFSLFGKEETYKRENLGNAINTQYDDLAPIISPDGRTLYFCRDGHPDNVGKKKKQDIWISNLVGNKWSTAEIIGAPLNNEEDNYVNSISPDGNTLLLGNLYSEKGSGFSISHRTAKGWSMPEKVNIKNYYNKSSYASSFLSSDGEVMLLGIQSKDNYGDCDIYVCFREGENSWSASTNLGEIINTKEFDYAPFLAADGVTLFFSSRGHGGYGNGDIFYSRRLDDTWKNWTKPENLGEPFNTAGNDDSFYITASGNYAYFASNDNSLGKRDIFRIRLPEKFKPKPVVLVYGKVFNTKTKQPLGANIYYEYLENGKEVGMATSNPVTGEYKIILPAGNLFGFRAEVDGFLSVCQNLDATKISSYKEINYDLDLVPFEVGQIVRLNNIFFDTDKSDLRRESFPELDRFAKFLKAHPNVRVEVGGHTDNVGDKKYNVKLSQTRAQAVTDYLIGKGIDTKRISTIGYGESKSVANNKTEAGRQLNRRVEFQILSN